MTEELLVKTLLDARPRVVAGAFAVVRDAHAAEDVFQEVLLRALRMRESFSDEGGVLASRAICRCIVSRRCLPPLAPLIVMVSNSGRAFGWRCIW